MAKAAESKKKRKPVEKLTKAQLREQLLEQASSAPHVLTPAQYETWLDHTVLARLERGEQELDAVRAALNEAASHSDTKGARQLRLAAEALDRALTAFQYSALKFNVMYMPSIGGRPVMNAILWQGSPSRQ
jgi:hypothetical protein